MMKNNSRTKSYKMDKKITGNWHEYQFPVIIHEKPLPIKAIHLHNFAVS